MKSCCVIGLGYIGLPTAIILAKSGFFVNGVDIKEDLVRNLNKGQTHFKEPGLGKNLREVIKNKKFIADINPKESDVFIVAVPTPINKNNKDIPQPNVKYVFEAAKLIGKYIRPGNIVIIESTSPVGTSEKVLDIIIEISGLSLKEIYLSYCPERVLPGNILEELVKNNRIIGGINIDSAKKTKQIYETFCKGKIELTNVKTAELVKLTENAYRDVNLAFANELSLVCNKFGVNVFELIEHTNLHPRVNILNPGCGVGGHCIAVDPWFIVNAAPEITPLIKTSREVNQNKTIWAINFIAKKVFELEKQISRKPIVGCFGLTFKADIEDIRESPALQITTELYKKGLDVMAFDPNLISLSSIKLSSLEDILEKADIYVILVGHKEFKKLVFNKKNVIDFCGISNNSHI